MSRGRKRPWQAQWRLGFPWHSRPRVCRIREPGRRPHHRRDRPNVRRAFQRPGSNRARIRSSELGRAADGTVMLILFDQATPFPLRKFLPGHVIKTAYQQGWSTLLNGDLLRVAEESGFDLLLTADKNLAYQQNLSDRKIAIVALGKNRWSLIEPELDRIAAIVNAALPGSYHLIDLPSKSGAKT